MIVPKIENFNTEPLIMEIENVIKTGLKTILTNYLDRYELLEKTHTQIMMLPSIRAELNKHNVSSEDVDVDVNEEDSDCESSMFVSIKNITSDLVRTEMVTVENKLNKLEQKYETIFPILDKILN